MLYVIATINSFPSLHLLKFLLLGILCQRKQFQGENYYWEVKETQDKANE